MKNVYTCSIGMLGRGLLFASALVLGSGCVAESAAPDEELSLGGEETAAEAQAQTILPNCRGATGRAWRLVRFGRVRGACSMIRPNHDPSEWLTSAPLPSCAWLWRRLGCVYLGPAG
ncbi:hypothetical protein [Polyangium spumosum]|uniref:Uncharacterized protein n=1 Tax=Polyangium spumosum TaxID=889282 RepID=A0A6N7PZ47_9BACT|nr:hypothetical protein [Polyangium spumosum]MRG97149.1 hypothetical protein [Polyangium spumosum]